MRNANQAFTFSLIFFLTTCSISCSNNEQQKRSNTFLDLSAVDSSVKVQDNLFLHVNGTWIKNAVIPPSQPAWGALFSLSDHSTSNMHTILDSISKSANSKGSIEQQVGDLYASAMDSVNIEKAGKSPINEELSQLAMVKDPVTLINEIAAEYVNGHNPAFSFFANADDKNSTMVVAHFAQGGIGLPNKDYYFKQDSSIKKIRDAYLAYIKKTFELLGDAAATAEKSAAAVLKLETALAKSSKTPQDLRDPNANYHKLSTAALNKMTPGIDWKNLLSKMMINQDTVLVGQPEFYTGLGKLLHDAPISDWKNYLRFHIVDDYASLLDSTFFNANFNYSKLITGQKEPEERWKSATNLVDSRLGDALGQLYVKKYFPPEAKKRMTELVNNLATTYEERIKGLDWMGDSTKQKALTKLHAIVRKIGYPDKWKDYSSVTIYRDSPIVNLRNCGRYNHRYNVNKIGKPTDRSEWYMTPATPDAYYNPTANDINFPAGILQPPFFFEDGDDAINYGAIGIVIGHEITHGFDDEGRHYDADGNLKEWWTKEDGEKFEAKAKLAIDQYNKYLVVDTFHINGKLTLGENIADIGGCAISFAAWQKTEQAKNNQPIDGLTPAQRFFFSFGQIWRVKYRDEILRTSVLNNPHSTATFRVNGPASNAPGFYEAFNVKPGDGMFRADSIRVHIW